MKQNLAIGVDIGGSHISCQLVDLKQNTLLKESKVRMTVNNLASKQDILNCWQEALLQTAGKIPIASINGIGFAMPGPFDYPKGIALFDKRVQKFANLYGVNIKEELIVRLQLPKEFPIRFLNDAASFAVGEAWLGQAASHNKLIALTLGTGFGTTFIRNGLPVAGEEGIPEDGFLYHIPFQHSIADDYFSTRWFVQEFEKRTGKRVKGVKELAELSNVNHTARELFKEFGTNLGNFMLSWVKNYKAECIVTGGNISKSMHLFKSDLEKQLAIIKCKIYPSSLDEDAAIIGSAKLCDNNFYSNLYN